MINKPKKFCHACKNKLSCIYVLFNNTLEFCSDECLNNYKEEKNKMFHINPNKTLSKLSNDIKYLNKNLSVHKYNGGSQHNIKI